MYVSLQYQTQMQYSFSLLLPNLLVGLCRGSRALRPASIEFRRDLGYRVFRLEPNMTGKRPDAALTSKKLQHTLLVEWTEAQAADERKRRQLRDLSALSDSDIVTVLAVPKAECASHDVFVVVAPTALDAFTSALERTDQHLPVVTFEKTPRGFALLKKAHSFGDQTTERVFSNGITVESIPTVYVPVPLDISAVDAPKLYARIVCTKLLGLIARAMKSVTVDALCESVVPAWNVVDTTARRDMRRAITRVVDKLARAQVGAKLGLARTKNSPVEWSLGGAEVLRSGTGSIRRELQEFVSGMEESFQQLSLNFGPNAT